MDIRELRYIAEIGKTKHMARAASNLYISQPALHKALRKTEAELNTTIFYRQGNELHPTDTGKVVIETAAEVNTSLAKMKDAIAATQNLQRGKVTIGFPTIVGTIYLPNLLTKFQRKYTNISLRTREAGGAELIKLVTAGELDMAIVMRPILSDALNEIPLVQDQVVVGVENGSAWAQRDYVTIKDFSGVPFNTFDQSFNMHTQLAERFQAEQVPFMCAFSSSSCQFLYEISRLSQRPLILPKPILKFYSRGDMTLLPFRPVFPWELCLIFPKNAFVSTAAKALIGHIQEYLFTGQ